LLHLDDTVDKEQHRLHGCAKEIDEQMTEMLQKTDENRIEK